MSASRLDIWNMALSHLAISYEVQAEDERSKEAQACRRFYDRDVEETLRDAPWPFATQYVTLELVEDAVNPEWDYAYRYPSGMLSVRRLLNMATRQVNPQNKVPFRIVSDATGKLILTDFQTTEELPATAECTALITEEEKYDPDFVKALSYQLANSIGSRLANDKSKLPDRALVLYNELLDKTKANAYNEALADEEPDSEFVRARQ